MGGIPWTKEEDELLRKCIEQHGEGKWHRVPLLAGVNRCRKSCRLRWLNYLRPNIKRGSFEEDEVRLIIKLHSLLGNRWSLVAARLAGRTGNDVRNYWNSHLSKKLNAQQTENGSSGCNINNVQVAATTTSSNTTTLQADQAPILLTPSKYKYNNNPAICVQEHNNMGREGDSDPIMDHHHLPFEQLKQYHHREDDDFGQVNNKWGWDDSILDDLDLWGS